MATPAIPVEFRHVFLPTLPSKDSGEYNAQALENRNPHHRLFIYNDSGRDVHSGDAGGYR